MVSWMMSHNDEKLISIAGKYMYYMYTHIVEMPKSCKILVQYYSSA